LITPLPAANDSILATTVAFPVTFCHALNT
jgi:hypothetical protein